MDIPVAVPIMDINKSAEEYELEQKRDALYRAEQDLASIISSAEDFFDSPSDKEAVIQQIQKNPEEIIDSSSKPFMKKIARAMIAVASLTKEINKASCAACTEQHLTLEQVKVQIAKELAVQRTFLETIMEERMETERARYEKMLLEQKTLFEDKLSHMEGILATLHVGSFGTKVDIPRVSGKSDKKYMLYTINPRIPSKEIFVACTTILDIKELAKNCRRRWSAVQLADPKTAHEEIPFVQRNGGSLSVYLKTVKIIEASSDVEARIAVQKFKTELIEEGTYVGNEVFG